MKTNSTVHPYTFNKEKAMKISNDFTIDKLVLLSITFILVFCIMNLPPLNYLPLKLGPFSLNKILIIMLLYTLTLSYLSNRYKFQVNTSDFLFIPLVIVAITRINDVGIMNNLILLICLPYFVGKLLAPFNVASYLKIFIMIAGLIQAIIAQFVPIDFNHTVENSTLFTEMSTQTGTNGFRLYGSVGHAIVLGLVLLGSLICWLDNFVDGVHNNGKLRMVIYGIPILFISYTIYLTYSRSIWIALLITFLIFLITKRLITNRKIIILLALSLALIVLFGNNLLSNISLRFMALDMEGGSVSHRLYMIEWAKNLWLSSPLNFFLGIGYFKSAELILSSLPPDGFPVMDNMFMTMLVEFGLIGMTSFLVIMFLVIRKIKNQTALVLIVIAFLISGCFFDLIWWEGLSILIFFLTGIILGDNNKNYR